MTPRGGKRDGAGRSVGSTKDRVKLGVSISRENAEWLREQKDRGRNISTVIDEAIEQMRNRQQAVAADKPLNCALGREAEEVT